MFEAYLVREQLITADELVDALEHQFHSRPPIGQLAVTSGMISMKQAFHLVGLQMTLHRRFGELAIELGYLTDDDIESLLAQQSRLQLALSEVLVARNTLSAEILREAQVRYYSQADAAVVKIPVVIPVFTDIAVGCS